MMPTKMLRWAVLASVGTLALACGGGVTTLGSGEDGMGGTSGMESGTAGTAAGKGGSMATAGKGPGSAGTGAKPGGEPCTSDMQCGVTDLPCEICADGSQACLRAQCVDGMCVASRDECQDVKCSTDMDCPVRDIACKDCGDGTSACEIAQCIMGYCQNSAPVCKGHDVCVNQPCGTPCMPILTDPGMDAAAPLAAYCNDAGQCQAGAPQCKDECSSAMDCGPAPPECKMCPGGVCAHFDCLQGQCVFGCPKEPEPEPECMVTEDCPIVGDQCILCPATMKCAVQACLGNKCEMVCPVN